MADIREFISILKEYRDNWETDFPKAKKVEPPSYEKGFVFDYSQKGLDLHKARIAAPAIDREMLEYEKLNPEQLRGLHLAGTLCWACQHPYSRSCNWCQNKRPVAGWAAERRDVNHLLSYYVLDCPNYIPSQRPRYDLSDYRGRGKRGKGKGIYKRRKSSSE